MDGWVLDGAAMMGLLRPPKDEEDAAAPNELQINGTVKIEGKISARLEKGVFREGGARIRSDATDLDVQYGELFQKRRGDALGADLAADGTGKSVAISRLRVFGPAGMKIALKGAVTDLKDYVAKLEIAEGKFPLATLAGFVPKAGNTSGLVELGGEVQGSLKDLRNLFAKLEWNLKNVMIQHDSLELRRLTGKVETVVSQGTSDDAAAGASYLVRIPSLTGQWVPPSVVEGEAVLPLTITTQGKVSYVDHAATGELSATVSPIDLRPWLTKKESAGAPNATQAGGETDKGAAAVGALDLKRSRLKLSLNSPRIGTPYLDFSDARAVVVVGQGGSSHGEDAPDLRLERLSGQALQGTLSLSAAVKLGRAPNDPPATLLKFSGSGQNLSLEELSAVLNKVSGKNLEQSFFGRGDIDAEGGAPGGWSSADVTGTAEIRDGGFKFLPVPRRLLDHLRNVNAVAEKLPGDKQTGQVTEKFEKAKAKFHLKGDKLELDLETLDSFLAMNAKGYVTVAGRCDMKGVARPTDKLAGSAIASRIPKEGIPFTAVGDNWACPPSFDDQALIKGFASSHLEKAKEEAGKVIKNSLKGILGK
jgi:hypothetical protein